MYVLLFLWASVTELHNISRFRKTREGFLGVLAVVDLWRPLLAFARVDSTHRFEYRTFPWSHWFGKWNQNEGGSALSRKSHDIPSWAFSRHSLPNCQDDSALKKSCKLLSLALCALGDLSAVTHCFLTCTSMSFSLTLFFCLFVFPSIWDVRQNMALTLPNSIKMCSLSLLLSLSLSLCDPWPLLVKTTVVVACFIFALCVSQPSGLLQSKTFLSVQRRTTCSRSVCTRKFSNWNLIACFKCSLFVFANDIDAKRWSHSRNLSFYCMFAEAVTPIKSYWSLRWLLFPPPTGLRFQLDGQVGVQEVVFWEKKKKIAATRSVLVHLGTNETELQLVIVKQSSKKDGATCRFYCFLFL